MTAPLRFHVDRANVIAALGLAVIAGYFAVLARAITVWNYDQWMVLILLPLLAFVGALIIRAVTRNDARPLTTLMTVALLAKLGATFVRYFVTFELYGYGDSALYDEHGAEIANAFHNGDLGVLDIVSFRQETQFIDDLTGLIYTIMGPSRLGGFLVFSFIGFGGLILFHRAARIGVPELAERRYAILLFFMPTLIFWPSSIGKEAVMLFALGLGAYGSARLLARRRTAVLPLAAGIGLAYLIRPHVAFVMLLALAVALLFRRRQRTGQPTFGPFGRLLIVVGLAIAAAFALGQAVDRLLPVSNEATGVEAVGDLLDRAESGTAAGGSQIARQTPNSPFEYPQAVFSVLFRPTIFDATSAGNAVAAAETTLVLIIAVLSWRRLKNLPTLMFRRPYLILCVVYIGVFAFAWSSFSNLGALVRQRVQVWPFVLLLLALPVVLPRRASAPGGPAGPDRHVGAVTGDRLVRHPHARWRQCVDGVVVMAAEAPEPVFLASPGDAIWMLLEQPRTVDELVDALAPEFDGDRTAIAADVAAFTADLERAGLLQR